MPRSLEDVRTFLQCDGKGVVRSSARTGTCRATAARKRFRVDLVHRTLLALTEPSVKWQLEAAVLSLRSARAWA